MVWEYYCEGCLQLRLFPSSIKPHMCGACGSSSLDIDEAGSERLKKRRYGDKTPDGKYTAVVFKP